jgi:5'(3')-deoxyribonucleotidase
MSTIKIYFDLDGVLADFNAAAAKFKNPNDDLNHPTSELDDAQKRAKTEFWHKIEKTDFYLNLPLIAGVENILDAAREIAGENLFILSKVPNRENFASGAAESVRIAKQKTNWVLAHFRNYFALDNILIVAGKKEQAFEPAKNDILIDDRAENINAWNAAGGTGILFISPADASAKLQFLSKNV